MKGFAGWAYNASWFTLGIVFASIMLFGVVAVQASTTISANISTGGTLDVTGLSTLTAGFVSQASSTVAGGAFTAADTLRASSTLQATGAVRFYSTLEATGASTLTGDITGGGGSGALTLTTTNAATSTATIGCIQMYATSTDTAIRLGFTTSYVSTTTHRVGSGGTAEIGGTMVWSYGSCS